MRISDWSSDVCSSDLELTAFYPGRLRVIEGDALDIDARSLFEGTPAIVANLSYNVGTALFVRWLSADSRPRWRSLTLMFQREVAVRIVAAPGTAARSDEHTSELQSITSTSYPVFCLNIITTTTYI